MWPQTFGERLDSWNRLRESCQNLPIETALATINQWWFKCPWKPYYLHWDDQPNWPDPWQLLSDDTYCEVARGLGILYTITLLDRADIAPVDMILTDDGTNLVRVAKEKYILNWEPGSIVNTNQEITIKRKYQNRQIN